MNAKKLILTSLVLVSVVFTVGCAGKFHKGELKNFIFERFDKNDDNKLSKKEHFTMTYSRFERMDENKDDELSKRELENSMFSNMKENFFDYYLKRYDLNKDAKVTKSELIEKTKEEFSSLDNDNDGFISKNEYKKQKSPFEK